jgi:hypothetical protein
MDLRDRASYEELCKQLDSVPSDQYKKLGGFLRQVAAQEAQVDLEASRLGSSLLEKEAISKMSKVGKNYGILRLHAFSLIESSKRDSTYTYRLSGDGGGGKCFSDFISRVEFVLTPSMESVVWTRSESSNNDQSAVDGITIARSLSGDNVSVEATIHVNYRNCLYEVPGVLSNSKKVLYMTFVDLFKAICAYIKSHNLSSNDDPSYFTPDHVIHEMLYPTHPKELPVSFASLLEAIRHRFRAPGPFKIVHKVGSPEQIFDLTVHVPDSSEESASSHVAEADLKLHRRLTELDQEIAASAYNLGQTNRDAKFLDKLATNPVEFLKQIIEMPTGKQDKIESSGTINYLNMTTSHEFYKQPWAIAAATYVVNEQKKEASV